MKSKIKLLPIFSGVLFLFLLSGKFDVSIFLLGLIAFIDYSTFYIPDILVLLIILTGVVKTNIINITISFLIVVLLIYYAKKDKLGYGDIKLLFGLSLIYGINTFYIIIFSTLIALIFGRKERVPFGYYLFWGTIVENIWILYFPPLTFF